MLWRLFESMDVAVTASGTNTKMVEQLVYCGVQLWQHAGVPCCVTLPSVCWWDRYKTPHFPWHVRTILPTVKGNCAIISDQIISVYIAFFFSAPEFEIQFMTQLLKCQRFPKMPWNVLLFIELIAAHPNRDRLMMKVICLGTRISLDPLSSIIIHPSVHPNRMDRWGAHLGQVVSLSQAMLTHSQAFTLGQFSLHLTWTCMFSDYGRKPEHITSPNRRSAIACPVRHLNLG